MTKEQMIQEMKRLAQEMQNLTKLFDVKRDQDFSQDEDLTIDDPPPRGGGYPKFPNKAAAATDPATANDLQRRWLAISTQLVKMIANPHISRDDIKAVFKGIGMLGGLYVEKFKSDDVS